MKSTDAEIDSKATNPVTSSPSKGGGKNLLITLAVIGCGILASMLHQQKKVNQVNNQAENLRFSEALATLQAQLSQQKKETQSAKSSAIQAKVAQEKAEILEKKHRDQLVSLGVTNDHLIAWMMRDHSQDLPELQQSATARDTLIGELQQFLKITQESAQFQPVRARIMMQLAELEIHKRHPAKADVLLDSAVAAWDRSKIEEPGHAYRVARARLACLIQATELGKNELAQQLLLKARKAAEADPADGKIENRRLQAVMHILDARMHQSENPEKALEDFEAAIEDMKGIQRTLTEHIIVRSDLARYTLEAAKLADSLNRMNEATRLRDQAVIWLKELLKKTPELQFPKIQLAEIHLISASSAINQGRDQEAVVSLDKAETLLKNMPAHDLSLKGAPMQNAKAKGLRAILLRDAGKTTEAKRLFEEAIQMMNQIVVHQKDQPSGSNEALYQLAILHWQYAGMIGDSGDKKAELAEGKKAADLMEELLKKGAGKYDIGIRRALGYLYGDLGHTAAQQGYQPLAAGYYKSASTIWQSLLDKHGKEQEYTDGLKWSQERYKQVRRK